MTALSSFAIIFAYFVFFGVSISILAFIFPHTFRG